MSVENAAKKDRHKFGEIQETVEFSIISLAGYRDVIAIFRHSL